MKEEILSFYREFSMYTNPGLYEWLLKKVDCLAVGFCRYIGFVFCHLQIQHSRIAQRCKKSGFLLQIFCHFQIKLIWLVTFWTKALLDENVSIPLKNRNYPF